MNTLKGIGIVALVLLFLGDAGLLVSAGKDHGITDPQNMDLVSEGDSATGYMAAWPLTVIAPVGAVLLDDEEETKARAEVVSSIRGQIPRSQSGAMRIEHFDAARLPDDGGWLMLYTFHLPAQEDYYSTIEEEQAAKLKMGIENGTISRVIESGRIALKGHDLLKFDLEAKDGSRMILLTYWTKADPSMVSNVSLLVSSPAKDKVRSYLDHVLASLKIQ